MKPHQSLMFLCSILIISVLFTYFSPGGEYNLSENLLVKLPAWSDLTDKGQADYADIEGITKEFTPDLEEDTTTFEIAEVTTLPVKAAAPDTTTQVDSVFIDTNKLRKNTFPIEFREGGENDLYAFTSKLQSKSEGKKLRVMFYGDSQSEADRITNEMRATLQELYGGQGVGLMPVYDDHPSFSKCKVTFEGNWQRFNRYAIRKRTTSHNNYGSLLSFSRFTGLTEKDRFVEKPDSTIVDEEQVADKTPQPEEFEPVEQEASITIHKQKYPKRKHYFESIKLFFGNNPEPFSIAVLQNDSVLYERTVSTEKEFDYLKIDFKKPMQELTLRFRGVQSPDFYGYSLEGSDGIVVDNIPMRGSSGLEFTKTSLSHQQKMLDVLKPDFIVLQFGVNMAPSEAQSYSFYYKGLSRQIQRLRTMCPEIPILVIGLNDVARKEGLHYESYSNIEKIVEAQRQAAFENNCAFWNMYEAMGGANSMPSWVLTNPPLAGKDFTHFNYRGAKIIGQMLSNAMLHEISKNTDNTNSNDTAITSIQQ